MNKEAHIRAEITLFLIFLLASACTSHQATLPLPTEKQTVLPTETTLNTAVTLMPNVTNESQPTIQLPLPDLYGSIIYSTILKTDNFQIWATNPTKPAPTLITTNVTPRGWSPSSRSLLFTGNHSIYVVNANNPDLQLVYTNNEYIGFDPFWLTNDTVLFNAYKDFFSPPDIYSLNINSKSATQLFPESDYFIQTTFPSEKKWLRGNWNTGDVDTVDQEGKSEKFFNDFSVVTDPFSTYPKFQRIDRLDKYLFQAKKSNETDYKLWLLSKQDLPEILFDPGSGGIDKFAVSPNEQYVALTYASSNNVYVYIFDLNSLQLVQQWIYPYKLSTADFIWSPDSKSIALPYSDGSSSATGLQIMDIMTGRTNVLLKDNVDQILDWP